MCFPKPLSRTELPSTWFEQWYHDLQSFFSTDFLGGDTKSMVTVYIARLVKHRFPVQFQHWHGNLLIP